MQTLQSVLHYTAVLTVLKHTNGRALLTMPWCMFNSIVTKGNLSEDDELRLENLCAVYAFKLYSLCNDDSISSFSAGDLKISSSADGESRAERLWREYADKSQDLIGREKFLLGVI